MKTNLTNDELQVLESLMFYDLICSALAGEVDSVLKQQISFRVRFPNSRFIDEMNTPPPAI